MKLLLEDGTPYPLEGTLQFRDVTVDPTTGSVTLRMVFPNPDHVLLPGMFVRASSRKASTMRRSSPPSRGSRAIRRGTPSRWSSADGKVEQRMLESAAQSATDGSSRRASPRATA